MRPMLREVRDAIGRLVPDPLRQVFWARHQIAEFVNEYRGLIGHLEGVTAKTPEWADAKKTAYEVVGKLWMAAPYCVCPYCKAGEDCDVCGDKRWLTEREYRATEKQPLVCEE